MRLATQKRSVFVATIFAACFDTGVAIKRSGSDMLDPGAHRGSKSFASLPHGSRIAILFRGQVFRGSGMWGGACNTSTEAVEKQLFMTKSALDKIVLPLEKASHTVDIYLFDSSNCSMLERIVGLLGTKGDRPRVLFQQSFRGNSQSDSMNRTVKEFTLHDPEKYRVILMLRFDVTYKSYIYEWPTVNYGKFNFYSHCELHSEDPRVCVNDIVQVMPGKYFVPWQRIVGKDNCFNGHPGPYGRDCGHFCYNQLVVAVGQENIGFVTGWMPEQKVREASPDLELF